MKKQNVINDQTKFDLKFNNLYGIGIALIVIVASWFNLSVRVDLLTQKVDTAITQQQELIGEFRSWKTQAETRLGVTEIKISRLETLEGIK